MNSTAAAPRVGGFIRLLWLLTLLFFLRVVGQALVAFLGVTWLPPMSEWYSGLLPYLILLPVQIIMLPAMALINRTAARGRGWFAQPHPLAARRVVWFAAIYALAMLARWIMSAWLHPQRWQFPPGTIPILFHWVLAGYLFLIARRLRGG